MDLQMGHLQHRTTRSQIIQRADTPQIAKGYPNGNALWLWNIISFRHTVQTDSERHLGQTNGCDYGRHFEYEQGMVFSPWTIIVSSSTGSTRPDAMSRWRNLLLPGIGMLQHEIEELLLLGMDVPPRKLKKLLLHRRRRYVRLVITHLLSMTKTNCQGSRLHFQYGGTSSEIPM